MMNYQAVVKRQFMFLNIAKEKVVTTRLKPWKTLQQHANSLNEEICIGFGIKENTLKICLCGNSKKNLELNKKN